MNTLAFASITDLQKKLKNKEISPKELVEFFVRRFEAFDGNLESALEIFDLDSIMHASAQQGSLYGIPGLIKANINIKDRNTSCASKILSTYKAPYDATAIVRLKQQGAPLIGYANMDEFAMGSSTETSAFKKTKNPWDTSRVPGGSSGGSAAAVAAGLVPWALGSDTGGSVRQPAAFCGIVGLKPTYGSISRYGLVAYASSLDQIGVMARTVHDTAMVFSAIAGHDIRDSSSLGIAQKDYTKSLDGSIPANLKIGILENALTDESMNTEIISAVKQAVQVFEKLGARVTYVNIPVVDYSTAVYFIISRAEAASNLARFDGVRYGKRVQTGSLADMYAHTRHDGFGPEVRNRIMLGNYVLSSGHVGEFYHNANNVRNLIRQSFIDMFKDVDLLLIPTHPVPAFKFGAYDVNKLQMDLQDYFTCPMNLAGVPAISLPCGFTKERLPIGFQLIGPHSSEERILQVAYAYEQQTMWYTQYPQGY